MQMPSSSWVKFLVYFPKSLICYVSVDLGSTDIAVAQHHLNRAKVGAVFQEMSSKAVPEQVRRDMANAGSFA